MKNNSTEVESACFTIEQLSKYLNLGINRTRALVARTDFPKITVGSRYLIPRKAVDTWLEDNLYKEYHFPV